MPEDKPLIIKELLDDLKFLSGRMIEGDIGSLYKLKTLLSNTDLDCQLADKSKYLSPRLLAGIWVIDKLMLEIWDNFGPNTRIGFPREQGEAHFIEITKGVGKLIEEFFFAEKPPSPGLNSALEFYFSLIRYCNSLFSKGALDFKSCATL